MTSQHWNRLHHTSFLFWGSLWILFQVFSGLVCLLPRQQPGTIFLALLRLHHQRKQMIRDENTQLSASSEKPNWACRIFALLSILGDDSNCNMSSALSSSPPSRIARVEVAHRPAGLEELHFRPPTISITPNSIHSGGLSCRTLTYFSEHWKPFYQRKGLFGIHSWVGERMSRSCALQCRRGGSISESKAFEF